MMGSTIKVKEIAPTVANSFPLELIPIEKGSKNENIRVTFPESIRIHFKRNLCFIFMCMICPYFGIFSFLMSAIFLSFLVFIGAGLRARSKKI